MVNVLKKPAKVQRTDDDIVESASVTALMRYLMSNETGRAKNPDYLGNIFVNGKWTAHLDNPQLARENLQKKLPGCIYYHLIRTKHFDSSLLKWINNNPNSQVIILGSGFDSRPIRFKTLLTENNIKIYEVDLKALLNYKQEVIQKKLGLILDNVKYVSCNFQRDNVITRLQENDFDINKPTFILWEGVTYFLTEENNTDYLKLFKDNIKNRVHITFDYDFRAFVEGDQNFYGAEALYHLTTVELGEPHLFGLNYEEVEDFANKNGYKLISNYTSFMLEALYLRDTFDNSVGTPHGFVGIAEIIKRNIDE